MPLPDQSIPSRSRCPCLLSRKGVERLGATVTLTREGPGIYRLTTAPSDASPFPAAFRPTLQIPAGGGQSRDTGLGHESKAMRGLPSVSPARSQRKDPYAALTSLAPSLPLASVIGADYKALGHQPRPRTGSLPNECSDGLLTHSFQEQSGKFLDVDCHADLVRTADLAHRREDLSVIPGNVQLVPLAHTCLISTP